MLLDILAIGLLVVVVFSWIIGMYALWVLLRTKVPLVPTPKYVCEAMLTFTGHPKHQRIYDLGSGLGHILLYAAKKYPENTFIGFDLLCPAVMWANLKAKWSGAPVTFYCKDFFKEDLRKADIIFCYLWPEVMDRFYQEIYPHLKPGTKIISHAFPIKPLTPKEKKRVKRAKIFYYER